MQFVGCIILVFRIAILLKLSHYSHISAKTSFAAILLLGYRDLIPLPVRLTERKGLTWLIESTVMRGCPGWYRPFATQKVTRCLHRCLNAWLVLVAVNLLVQAVPPTLKLSSKLLPDWLLFLDLNHDGRVTGSEFIAFVLGHTSKICSAVIHWVVGRAVLRLKDPTPRELNYATPSLADSGSANIVWMPLVHLIVVKHQAEEQKESSIVHQVDKALSVAVYCVMLSSCVHIFGLRLRTLLTVGGVAGLAIGLAAKDLAQNLISGILLYTNKSIKPGLEMELMNRGLSGIVDNVGLFNTEISLYDGILVRVPNAEVFQGVVAYKDKKRARVVDECFIVQLSDQMNLRQMVQRLQELLRKHPTMLHETKVKRLRARYKGNVYVYPPQCVFSGLSDHGAKLRVRAFFSGSLSGSDFLEAQSQLLLDINELVASMGGKIGIGLPPAARPVEVSSAAVPDEPEQSATNLQQDLAIASSMRMAASETAQATAATPSVAAGPAAVVSADATPAATTTVQ